MTFGERLKKLRKEIKFTQTDVGDFLGVSVQSYSAYESGREPGYSNLCKLAIFFDTTTDYLLGLSNNRYKTKEEAESVLIEKETEILKKLETCKTEIKELNEMIEAALLLFKEVKN